MSEYLSVEDAIAALDSTAEVNKDEATETGAETATETDEGQENTQADPGELVDDAEDGLETAPEDGEVENEGDEEDDGLETAPEDDLEAPEFWEDADKEAFASMTRQQKEILLKREAKFRSFYESKANEATTAKKAAEERATTYATATAQMEQQLDTFGQRFVQRWEQWTPEAWNAAYQANPEQTQALYAQFQQDAAAMQHLAQVKAQQDQIRLADYQAQQLDHLKALSEKDSAAKALLPDDPDARERHTALMTYLVRDLGVPEQRINLIGAEEMVVAYKAMLWDQSQAKLAKAKTQNPQAKPAQNSAKMRPAAKSATPQAGQPVRKQLNRFNQTKSVEDAVAALNLLEAQQRKK